MDNHKLDLMNFVRLLFVFLLFGLGVKGQNNRFVYLQTETGRPFYIKMKDSIISSSGSGYLILSNIDSGEIKLSVGFPQEGNSAINFLLPAKQKDLGLLIRKNNANETFLEDMQTNEMTAAVKAVGVKVDYVYDSADAFSALLVDVTGDSSILNKHTAAVTKITEKPSIDSSSIKKSIATEVKATEVPKIKKLYTRLDSSGRLMTFVVPNNQKNDTIVLFISYVKSQKGENLDSSKNEKEKPKEKTKERIKSTIKNEAAQQSNTLKDSISKLVVDTIQIKKGKTIANSKTLDSLKVSKKDAVKTNHLESNCKVIATDRDFINLRRRMVEQRDEQQMQTIAFQSFQKKCYSCAQVRNLSVLFLKDNSRYAFLELSFPYVFDKENFMGLQTVLTESSNIEQFKGLHK